MNKELDSDKNAFRERVLSAADIAIDRGMDRESIEQYVSLAREYGKQYGISSSVETWIFTGRDVFASKELAREWANTLP